MFGGLCLCDCSCCFCGWVCCFCGCCYIGGFDAGFLVFGCCMVCLLIVVFVNSVGLRDSLCLICGLVCGLLCTE